MRSINIYTLTREVRSEVLPLYEKSLSQRDEPLRIHEEEIALIRYIVNNFIFYKVKMSVVANWFYSFTIPQIGKEFDLIKLGKNRVAVNLELKSQEVSEEKIIKQLIQNQYYLSTQADTIYSFTYMLCENKIGKIFYLNDKKELEESSFEFLISQIEEVKEPITEDIEKLFLPKDYLISPLNTPQKFLDGSYFLNSKQTEIKNKIVSFFCGEKSGLWGIKGAAGTGKTLLLYDVIKSMSEAKKVCAIHCGILSDGHTYLNKFMKNVDIIDAKSINQTDFSEYDVVCVDETQRLYKPSLDLLLQQYEEKRIQGCVFAYDFTQVLSASEYRRNNPQRLREINGFVEEKLSEKIRTNREILSFVRNMMRLTDKPQKEIDYSKVDVVYANNMQEADRLLKLYQRSGYTFITFTPSLYKSNEIDHYSQFINSHMVIGQEFDNVVIILGNNFRYDANGDLEGIPHPNPDYLFPKLFYQNISRARERLCIIVSQNPKLFETILMVKEHQI
ncbi:MAG: DNA/RNA helicase domain-containing protein [Lachnospiraceae bacterium]|nr:DNA/RNA helicase domain-containing protein [Lachnospiraceae bacterium]